MIAALAALTLSAAPGCPGALAQAAALDDAALAPAALGVLARLERGGAGGPTLAVARAARVLSDAWELPGGRDAARLAAPARAFRTTLARHCEVAAAPVPSFAAAADRAALDEILARPEFRRARTDPLALRRLLLSAWDWLLERLGTTEAERWANTGRTLFLGAAAVAAALVLAARRRRSRPASPATAGAGPELTLAPAPDRSLSLAQAALARGEATAAVRHALLAALGALERAGRVPRGRALTNAELVRAVASADAGAGAELLALARRFDGAVYGGRPPSADEARQAVEGARRLGEGLA